MDDRAVTVPNHATSVSGCGRADSAPACDDPERRLGELARSRGALRWVLASLAAALAGRASSGPAPAATASAQPSPAGWERFGYVRAGDYARERLGMSGRSLLDLAHVGRALAGLPRCEAALVSGALPWSKVRLLARCAGPDDEAGWVALAARLSTRQLERRVRAVDRDALRADAAGGCDEDGTEPLETIRLRAGSSVCFRWQRARRWAARVAGERVPPGTALEMITAEALSALPRGVLAAADDAPAGPAANVCTSQGPRTPDVCALREPAVADVIALRGSAAADVCVPQAPARLEVPAFLRPLNSGLDEADAFDLDARLRRAVRLEQRLDAEIAGLLRLVTSRHYEWRDGPRTLAGLARESLGMSPRKARALLRIERVGEVCPELRSAWRDGSISWVQAQTLAPLLIGGGDEAAAPGWRAAWLGFARRVTVRRLDEVVGRALTLRDADPAAWLRCRNEPERVDPDGPDRASPATERQTCARASDLFEGIRIRVRAPREVARLFRAVLCALRRAVETETGRLPGEGEAFGAMIEHALQSWGVDDPRLRGRAPARDRRLLAVFDRDGWRCTIPGCTSQRNLHAHHIRFRSAGGGDEAANLTTLCAAHHHRGVHAGRVRVGGQAPDALWFELGVREGRAPLARYRSGDRVV